MRDVASVAIADADADAARAAAAEAQEAALGGALVAGGGLEQLSGAAVCVVAGGADGTLDGALVPDLARELAWRAPDAVVVVAAEPSAALCDAVLDTSELPRARVVGVGGIVASARARALVARRLGLPPREVAVLAAGRTVAEAVPLVSLASAGGAPLAGRVDADELAAELRALGPASAAALAAAAAEVADAVLLDRRRVVSCAVRLEGEHGVEGRAVAVPVELGTGGVARILRLDAPELSAAVRQR